MFAGIVRVDNVARDTSQHKREVRMTDKHPLGPDILSVATQGFFGV